MQAIGQHLGREAAHPLVEVAEHQLRAADVPIGDDGRQPLRLMTPFENRRAEMDVVDVQRTARRGNVDALQPPRLACLPGEIVLDVMRDRQPAEHGIAELVPAQVARRRHHPAHAERRADFLGVAAGRRSGADHFLQRDDVGVDRAQHRRDAIRARAAVEAAAAMNVVGRDAKSRASRRVSHEWTTTL